MNKEIVLQGALKKTDPTKDSFPEIMAAMDTYARQEAIGFGIWTMRNVYYIASKSRWYMYPTNTAYNIEGHTDEQIYDIFKQQSNG